MTGDKLDDSRLCILMNTNNIISDNEAVEVKRQIALLERVITTLDDQVKGASTILERLTRQRDEKQQRLTILRSIISPVRTLPVEILQRIFILCQSLYKQANPNPSHPPLLFGFICSRWRTISHTTPALWNSLRLSHYQPYNGGREVWLPETRESFPVLINEWLSRGKKLPLDIFLDRLRSNIPSSINLLRGIFPFTSFTGHIRRLNLSFFRHQLKPLLDLQGGMPLLQNLTICISPGNSIDESGQKQVTVFEKSPCLHTANIIASSNFLVEKEIRLPWSQLRTIQMLSSGPSAVGQSADLYILLFQAKNVQRLSITLSMLSHPTESVVNYPIYTHRELRELSIFIKFVPADPPPMELISFILSALRSLSIDVQNSRTIASLIDLQRRSKFSLESLTLSYSQFYGSILPLLKYAPELTSLRIPYLGVLIDPIFHALTYRDSDDYHLLPHLSMLEIDITKMSDNHQIILEMVESRSFKSDSPRGVAPLSKVVIGDTHRRLHPEIVHRFKELEKDGVLVTIINVNNWPSIYNPYA